MDARAWSRVPLPAAPGTASFVAALSNLRYGVCYPDRIGEHGINKFAPNANETELQPDAFPEIIAFNRSTAQKCLQNCSGLYLHSVWRLYCIDSPATRF